MFIEVPKREKEESGAKKKNISKNKGWKPSSFQKKKLSEVRTHRIQELSDSKQDKGEQNYIDTP